MLYHGLCVKCRYGGIAARTVVEFRVKGAGFQRSQRRYYASSESYYDVLSVPRHSTSKEIKAKFYELSRKFHPDISPDSTKRFTEINAAYSVLRDEKSRRDYDRTLPTERGPVNSPSGSRPASGLSRRRTRPVGTPPSSPFRAASQPTSNRPAGFEFGSNPAAEGHVRNQHFTFDEHRERHSTFDSRYNIKLQEELSRRNAELKDNFLARFLGIAGLVFLVVLCTGGISSVRAEVHTHDPDMETKQVDWEQAMQARRKRYEHQFWKR